ncbi:hypothetical protein OS493_034273 [Desmophyllum pertusum]|uniref:Uncharacterized protein n=1 Tax=Desmophyllum pertusum TaxID=174260 RepID=A0A9X0CNP8_9CNID|nr:hypothetical protein OS493_034273 [Desmophyllum pertusum]
MLKLFKCPFRSFKTKMAIPIPPTQMTTLTSTHSCDKPSEDEPSCSSVDEINSVAASITLAHSSQISQVEPSSRSSSELFEEARSLFNQLLVKEKSWEEVNTGGVWDSIQERSCNGKGKESMPKTGVEDERRPADSCDDGFTSSTRQPSTHSEMQLLIGMQHAAMFLPQAQLGMFLLHVASAKALAAQTPLSLAQEDCGSDDE